MLERQIRCSWTLRDRERWDRGHLDGELLRGRGTGVVLISSNLESRLSDGMGERSLHPLWAGLLELRSLRSHCPR